MPGLGYGPQGYLVNEPDPCNPGQNRLVYRPSDAEVEQLGKGLEHFLRETGELSKSIYEEVCKPIFWWASSIMEKIFG